MTAILPPDLYPAVQDLPGKGPVLLAFSGGGDSVCLLHQLRQLKQNRGLLVIHVDHGLDSDSANRAERALALARAMGLDCQIERVQVDREGSMEANAREARYAALLRHLEPGGVLLTAHHADDVAETMLLRLLRGAGPFGLAGIARQRRFGPGHLVRPLLSWRRRDIVSYLRAHHLDWIDDPTNELSSLDRNFIRHEALPLIQKRFPGAVRAITRSADLNRSALVSLEELSLADLDAAELDQQRLDGQYLAGLDPFRASELVRQWCIALGLRPPPGARLEEFLRQVKDCAEDRQPELRWADTVVRCWQNKIWLEPSAWHSAPDWSLDWDGSHAKDLPEPSGRLSVIGSCPVKRCAWRICSGQAAERIDLAGRGRRQVKALLTAHGVPPWQRRHWPRLYQEKRLLALGDVWLDSDFARELARAGARLQWHAPLFRPQQRSPSAELKPALR